KEEETFGISSYHISRVDQKNPAPGVLVNKKPIVVADGESDEPIVFFKDYNVDPGEVTYRITFEDWFGRKSAPSDPLKVTVKDLRSPPAVAEAVAELNGDSVMVGWTADQGDVHYKVTRLDGEQDAKQLLTATPISGE